MKHERGAALVTAMLVAALAAAVVATLAATQSRWMRSVELRRDQVQAQALVLAGLTWAGQVLREDAAAGPLDHLLESWALPLPPTPLENGSIEGRIVDAQGLVNLNNLAVGGAIGRSERKRAQRLFAEHGLPAAALDALADWIDEDDAPRENGGESAAYAKRQPALLPANAPLLRVAEATLVRDVDASKFASLAALVTALPGATPLNINTAPPEVLAAAVDGVSGDALATLVAERATRPFASVADFRSRLPSGATIEDPEALAVRSDFFLVTVLARQGETIAQGRALLKRQANAMPQVVWQTLE